MCHVASSQLRLGFGIIFTLRLKNILSLSDSDKTASDSDEKMSDSDKQATPKDIGWNHALLLAKLNASSLNVRSEIYSVLPDNEELARSKYF